MYPSGTLQLFWAKVNSFLMSPSALFNLFKLPVMWQFYVQETANLFAAFLFIVFWIFLTFRISRWGTLAFWASVLLQIAFVGVPEVRSAISSDVPDLLDLHAHWSAWLFAAGISLEILEWARNLRTRSREVQILQGPDFFGNTAVSESDEDQQLALTRDDSSSLHRHSSGQGSLSRNPPNASEQIDKDLLVK